MNTFREILSTRQLSLQLMTSPAHIDCILRQGEALVGAIEPGGLFKAAVLET
jgi:hypothetical protein